MTSLTSTAPGGPSLLMIEAGVSLIVGVIAMCWPQAGSRSFSFVERFFGRLARMRGLSVLAVGFTALVVRLCMLPLSPIPQPFVHDEFSYLLAADTFASGRLSNATHPMWVYFESFHITHKPSYVSMYFPAQGLALAVGKILAGHPWYGVWLSAGLMCSAICWMLQGWLPPGWALLGGMLAVVRLALFSYWINAYHGGAVAAIGGALVLGALPRMMRTFQVRHGLLMACGCAILVNSRPYEGLLVCTPAIFALFWWAVMKAEQPMPILIRRMIGPLALLLTVAACMGYYNHRVFGNVHTLPYEVNRATYAMAPVFLWQTPRPEPVYRHEVMRDFYNNFELADFQYARTPAGFLNGTVKKLGILVFFLFGTVLIAPLMMLPWVFRDRRVRFLTIAGGLYGLGLSANAWLFPHYAAPFVGAIYVILLQSMRHLRMWRPGGKPSGLFLVRILPMVCLALAGLRLFAEPLNITIDRWPTMWYGTKPLGLLRARISGELESYPGRQLAIVRYTSAHNPVDDWVYNAADIDKSKVVWAREMNTGNVSHLLRYFHDRRAWLVEPDLSPPRISPYPLQDRALETASLNARGMEVGQ